MDIYLTADEKYLQAIEELHWGELPKALQYFNELIAFDADYARAYYQLGNIYYHHFKNYQTAGYYYKKCMEIEENFPDVYESYLKLIFILKKHKLIKPFAEKALSVPGVCEARIYETLGLYEEKQSNFAEANSNFKKAELANENYDDQNIFLEHQKRIKFKINNAKAMIYDLQG